MENYKLEDIDLWVTPVLILSQKQGQSLYSEGLLSTI